MRFMLVSLLLISGTLVSFTQEDFDSLYAVWQDESQSDSLRITAYANYIFFKYGNYDADTTIVLSNELYDHSRQINSTLGMRKASYNLGFAYYRKGQFAKALRYLKESEKLNPNPHGGTLTLIGAIYGQVSDTEKLVEYWEKALAYERTTGDKRAISGSLINMGLLYREMGQLDTAWVLTREGVKLSKEIGASLFMAHGMSNMARMHIKSEQYDSATMLFESARIIYDSLEYIPGIALSYIGLGTIHSTLGEHQAAERNCRTAYEMGLETGDMETQYMSCQCLYPAYKALNNGAKALEFHELLVSLRDSLEIDEAAKKLQQMEFEKELLADSLMQEEEKLRVQMAHQREVREKNRTRNLLIGSGSLSLVFAGGLWSRLRYVRRSKATLQKEKDRSENLLLNILPEEIAEELKEKGRADARDFEMVSILFTDFKDFTRQSARLSAADLVQEINHCFEAFDGIIEKHGIEKIKTIGDAYMAAGGLPVPTEDSAKRTVLAALEMQKFIARRKTEQDAKGEPAFEMRVGIHTGPVVAGIVGVKKFQYDIWGDTVNTASRIESNGDVGKVNISHATYELIESDDDFSFEDRGRVQAKGKGEMRMYFVRLG